MYLKKIFFPILAIAIFSQTASGYNQSNANMLMLGGDHGDSTYGDQPLLISSNDNGQSWKIADLPIFTSTIKSGFRPLSDMLCQQGHCFAIANALGADNQNETRLYTSFDNGQAWQEVKLMSTPTTTTSERLNSISCNNNMCMVIGSRDNSLLTYVTNDNGITWSSMLTPQNISIQGSTVANCSDEGCNVVGGIYTKDTNQLVTLHTDNQSNWKIIKSIDGLPDKIKNSIDVGLSCHRKICVAIATVDPLLTGSIITVSRDAGQSWHVVLHVDGVDSGKIQLSKLYCDQNNCVAVGNYGSQPIIISSQDQGSTWKRTQIKGAPVNHFGALFDVACQANTCIAIGNDNLNIPYIAKSDDHGVTWNRIEKINHLPNKSWVFSSQSLVCNNQGCFIGSYYALTPSAPWNAYLLSSFDQGNTWEGSEIVGVKKFASSSLFVSSHTKGNS